jgi:hypothetical protein
MPSKKSKKAPKGLSPAETAAANKSGFDHATRAVPLLQFDDMMDNFGSFASGITDPFSQLFDQLIGRGEDATGLAPPTPEAPAQQLSPYEARIQELMTNREWSREDAVANQASAMKQGGDFNNDGAVTNNEWSQWRSQQPAAPAPQPRGQAPQQGTQASQPQQAPGMAAGQYQGVNLTPEQVASIQKFNGYGRGMV